MNARRPAAVAAGNVETSQRIVDVLLGALAQACPDRIPAASQGTMNNLTIGGWDERRGRPFAYYETIGGGMGAGPKTDGMSGRHSHMTNTLNTPVEALEYAYPFRISRYALREGSGGNGRQRGGKGLIRAYEFLQPAEVTLQSDRRVTKPYGLEGGQPGQPGRNCLRQDGVEKDLPGKCSVLCGSRRCPHHRNPRRRGIWSVLNLSKWDDPKPGRTTRRYVIKREAKRPTD